MALERNAWFSGLAFLLNMVEGTGTWPQGLPDAYIAMIRWGALFRCWEAVCRHGPCGPVRSLEPWVHWIPADLHGFFKWVFETPGVLNDFVCIGGPVGCEKI